MFCTSLHVYFKNQNDLKNGLRVLQKVPLPKGGAIITEIEVLDTRNAFFPFKVKLHLSDLTDIVLEAGNHFGKLFIDLRHFPVAFADYLRRFCRREPHVAWLSGLRQPSSPLFRLAEHPWFTANVILRNVFEYLYHSPELIQ